MVAVVYKEGRQWVSQCLNVDVASCGKTSDQALQKLKEAVSLYSDECHKTSMGFFHLLHRHSERS